MNYLSAIFHSDLERQSRKLSKASVYPQDALPSLHGTMANVVTTCYSAVRLLLLCFAMVVLLWVKSWWEKITIIKSVLSNNPWYVLGYHLNLARDFISTHKVNYEATKTVGKQWFSSSKSQIYQVSIFVPFLARKLKGLFLYLKSLLLCSGRERERLKLS